MTIREPKEVFVVLLSDVRQGVERATTILQEMSQLVADNKPIKEALEARILVDKQMITKLDECFKLIGAQPVKLTGRFREVWVEEFKKELEEIQGPVARHLFILAKASQMIHLRAGEYAALIAVADVTGHYGVGALLETCLAEKQVFIERTKRLITHIIETKVESKQLVGVR